jgi:phosphonate transport system substrate-binding protein
MTSPHSPAPDRSEPLPDGRRRQWLRGLAGLAAGSCLGRAGAAEGDRPTYSVAVVPQFPAAEIHREWSPLLERIGRDIGVTLTLRHAANIPRFESELLAGLPDLAYMNPYHAVMAMRGPGYRPLVRDARPLSGILVVRQDDPIRSVRELDGRVLAFPAPNAFGASLWMRALLAEREQIQITPRYVQTHSNVYRQVVRGLVAAGGGVNHTLNQEAPELRQDLRVLMETPGVASHPLSAHPRVPLRVQQAVADAFMRLAGEPDGLALLKAVALDRPVPGDHARDYRPLERYRLDKYVVLDTPA